MSVQYFSNSPKPKPIHIVSHTKYPLAPSTQDCTVIALCGTICTGDTPILFSTLRGLSMTDRVCPTCAGLSPEHSSAPKIIKTPDVERTLAHEVHMLTKMVCDLGNEVSKLKTRLDEARKGSDGGIKEQIDDLLGEIMHDQYLPSSDKPCKSCGHNSPLVTEYYTTKHVTDLVYKIIREPRFKGKEL